MKAKLVACRPDAAVLVCDLGAAAPNRVVICPWGASTVHGQRILLDEQAAAATIAAARARRVDMVIDYEHQTEGGRYASPDGTAPASGWIKELIAEPGVGLVARVEWTPRAARMIAAREYRYLSPVLMVSKKDGRVVGVRSVALTNAPAIDGFPAMVASRRGANKEIFMDELKTILGLPADATDAQVGEAVASLKSRAETATAIAKDLGCEVEAAPKAVQTLIARASNEGRAAETIASLTAKVTELAGEVVALRGRERDDAFERLIAKLDPKGTKVTPAERPALRAVFEADPEKVAVLVAAMREKVSPGGEGGAGGTPADPRATVIAKARADYRGTEELARLTSEQNYVNCSLRDAGMERLSEKEIAELVIARQVGRVPA